MERFRTRVNDFILRSTRVVTGAGLQPAAVVVVDGRITEIREPDNIPAGTRVDDVGDLIVMPGLVDTHVHVNEPGRTEWEGFDTTTRAAAAGGVTTIVDMPLNSIPATTNVTAFEEKLAAARTQCWVDTGFWGGLIDDNQRDLEPLATAGVLGFKAFLTPSGVPEFSAVSLADIDRALPILRPLDLPLLVHAELFPAPNAGWTGYDPWATDYACYLHTRPAEVENQAIAALIELAERHRTHIHIVHLASADALPMVRDAKARGVPITVETCPHYLYFSSDDIKPGATEFKCAPPIRDARHREGLIQGLEQGVIDLVVTDHSPCTPELKTKAGGDFFQAWGGIASLQLRLPIVLSVVQSRGFSFSQLTRWLSTAPARLAGLDYRKGTIATGHDADFVVWHPALEREVAPDQLLHRHKLTPYAGHTLPGVVMATYLRGRKIYDGTNVLGEPGGELLLLGQL
ncbi:MAG: allantoinase AllB [Gemmatimonadota bacterium]